MPPQIAYKVAEIGRISVVLYDWDQFVDGKLQLLSSVNKQHMGHMTSTEVSWVGHAM